MKWGPGFLQVGLMPTWHCVATNQVVAGMDILAVHQLQIRRKGGIQVWMWDLADHYWTKV